VLALLEDDLAELPGEARRLVAAVQA
jgi:hypothetical protein